MKLYNKNYFKLSFSIIIGVVTASCANNLDYQGGYSQATPRSTTNLTLPPGLTAPTDNNSYKMLNLQQQGYQLNNINNMNLVLAGSEIWLQVKQQSVNQVWPVMLAFLNAQNLNIKLQDPSTGLIQTEWAARNNVVKETGIRALFDDIGWGNQYSLQSQYTYRINLWQNESNTLIFVTDYQMNEVYPSCVNNPGGTIYSHPSDIQITKWMPIPPNPQIQLEFLQQFMVFAGLSPEKAKQIATPATNPNVVTDNAVISNNVLIVNDQFDRTWWRTGIALERANLGINDKNRSTGEYYVYPLQDDVDNPQPGFFDKLFGNNSNTLKVPKTKYIIKLQQLNDKTNITMSLYPGAVDKNFASNQKLFLELLQKQLK
jgi:outer membrane protein assembly factor BamC